MSTKRRLPTGERRASEKVLVFSACVRFLSVAQCAKIRHETWLDKHPCFKLHFTPTSASWLNLVKRFFAEITSRRIGLGRYSSVDDLEAAIYDYLAQHNKKPKPFRWIGTAEDILTRERRALDRLDENRRNR